MAIKQKNELAASLIRLGFELIDDIKTRAIEKIKNLFVDLIKNKNNDLKHNLSYYLSENLCQDCNTLRYLFFRS